jgi:hypothetical protein
MSNNEDNRKLEATLAKPVTVRIEHDGKTVYEQVHEGHTKLLLRDLGVPYSGTTVLFVNDKPIGRWQVRAFDLDGNGLQN